MRAVKSPGGRTRKFLNRRDAFILLSLALLCIVVLIFRPRAAASGTAAEAQIYVRSRLVETIPLTPGLNKEFPAPGQPNVTLRIQNGAICFYHSDCRDKICVKSGWLSRPGQSAACLPNQVAIKIVPAGNNNSGGADAYAS